MQVIRIAPNLLAVASAGIAVVTVTCGDSALLGHALPAWLPWRVVWVYGFAAAVLVASGGLCVRRTTAVSALTIATYYVAWGLSCIPAIVAAPLSMDAWYGFCEAVTALSGPWILSSLLRGVDLRAVRAAQVLFGLTCVFYGWSHFVYAEYTAGMVPGWLPARMGWAYFTGVGHIAAGVGIVIGILPRLAALLEAIMMSSFGLLVWVPSFFMQPRPAWAASPQSQWSELVLTLVVATSAWIVYNATVPGEVRADEKAGRIASHL
jgi:uncharacterized membrane protein YphA (DoxX/SURF4 family)